MSVLSNLQTWLEEYSDMEILTDQTDENTSSYALVPSGDELLESDCLGNENRQNSYVFYAKEAGANEIDRKDNHAFLESFAFWIDSRNKNGDFPSLGDKQKVNAITVSNSMLYGVDEDGTSVYQIQIQLFYTKENDLWQ